MQLQVMKSPTKADNDHSQSRRKRRKIQDDVRKIEDVILSDNAEEMKEIHMLIDGKYSAYVPNWGHSMYGYIEKHGFSYELLDKDSLLHNLTLMKYSPEGFFLCFEQTTKKLTVQTKTA